MSVVQSLKVAEPALPDGTLDKLAARIVELRLAEPAQFLLEAHKPLLTLGRHLGLLFQPLLAPVVGQRRFESLLSLCEDPQNIEVLLERLERYSAGKSEENAKK